MPAGSNAFAHEIADELIERSAIVSEDKEWLRGKLVAAAERGAQAAAQRPAAGNVGAAIAIPLALADRLTPIARRELTMRGLPGPAAEPDGVRLLESYVDAIENDYRGGGTESAAAGNPRDGVALWLPIHAMNELLARLRRELLAHAVPTGDIEPAELVQRWLNRVKEGRRPIAAPSAEPNDVLVKVEHGRDGGAISAPEVWQFTLQGWSRLQDPGDLTQREEIRSRQQAAKVVEEPQAKAFTIHEGSRLPRSPAAQAFDDVALHLEARRRYEESATGRAVVAAVKTRLKIGDALADRDKSYKLAIDALKTVHSHNKQATIKELELRRRGIAEARHIVHRTEA